ncbi:MAG: hypothetical protein RL226_343 [Bacteroidota bacterium]
MASEARIRLKPEEAFLPSAQVKAAAAALRIAVDDIQHVHVRKRSLDARREVVYQLDLVVYKLGEEVPENQVHIDYPNVHHQPAVHIIGAGPAGLFAALRLISLGLKPVIFERGKDVRNRRRDLVAITREHRVNEDSNYCFGEGGAGTYSDGKLYTRSTKRGDIQDVLKTLVAHGADPDITVNAHPHIGTNKLPGIIEDMRNTILRCGGEVHFEARVTDIVAQDGRVSALVVNDQTISATHVIVATGHSARDIFELFERKKWAIEAKTFALGVRVEHPQALIDSIQYHRKDRGDFLPPASYSLVCQVDDRGVYSFCMCPGGIIAPCATAPGEVVTNGWSPSKRNNKFANSGMVVTVEAADVEAAGFSGPLGAMHFQQYVERRCCEAAGGSQAAPAQRLVDFVQGKKSIDLPDCSYTPGIVSVNLHEVLPPFVAKSLAEGFKDFGRKMRGFMTNDAVVVGPESRTSSPVRIPRHPETLCHPDVRNLYPCGEGAGYAGGIVSAAIDGQKMAAAIAEVITR